jgi:hypothetical protein
MKRIFAIAICFTLFYASALWAFAGCDNLTAAWSGHHDDRQTSAHHHDDSSAPHHPDGGKIHCANLFGAFVAGSRITPGTDRGAVASLVYRVLDLDAELTHSAAAPGILGPPGWRASQSPPLYLLLSMIRI